MSNWSEVTIRHKHYNYGDEISGKNSYINLSFLTGAERLSGITRFMATWPPPTSDESGRASNTTPLARRARCRIALRRGRGCLCITLCRGTPGLSVLIVKIWTKNSDTQELPCDCLTGLTCRRSRTLGGRVLPARPTASAQPLWTSVHSCQIRL